MIKVSQATLIDLGLVGPKARLKSVTDGQQVNIPVQLVFRQSKTGTILIPISGTSVPEKGICRVKVALAQG